jgi:hypothetical protein
LYDPGRGDRLQPRWILIFKRDGKTLVEAPLTHGIEIRQNDINTNGFSELSALK